MKIKYLVVLIFPLVFHSLQCKTPIEPVESKQDTTSQNFTFQSYEFGGGYESSWLKDVWIFDENNIWAVGYIDTIGDKRSENIIRWDGKQWSGFGKQFNSLGIYGIWALDSSHIWMGVGVVLKYKNGVFSWEDFSNLDFSKGRAVHKLWGSSEKILAELGQPGQLYIMTEKAGQELILTDNIDLMISPDQNRPESHTLTPPEMVLILLLLS